MSVAIFSGWQGKARAALAVFVQATCQKDWIDKPAEARYDKWKHRLTLLAQPPIVLAIPYCFRSPSGDWYIEDDITCVTMDRQRILDLLTDADVQLQAQVVTLVEAYGANALTAPA